jgi:hypothetical protein
MLSGPLRSSCGLVVQVDQLLVATFYPCSQPEPEGIARVHVLENQQNDDATEPRVQQ